MTKEFREAQFTEGVAQWVLQYAVFSSCTERKDVGGVE